MYVCVCVCVCACVCRYKADEKDGKGSPGPPSGKGAPPPPGPRGPSANGHAPRGPKDTTGSPAGSVAINMSNGSGMSQKRANGVTADVVSATRMLLSTHVFVLRCVAKEWACQRSVGRA